MYVKLVWKHRERRIQTAGRSLMQYAEHWAMILEISGIEMATLPRHLNIPGLRFIKLRHQLSGSGKDPIQPLEKEYKHVNCYDSIDISLWLKANPGMNYGVLGGPKNLIIIDFDDSELQRKIHPLLPKTFTVKSAGKGLFHCYYFIDDMVPKVQIHSDRATLYIDSRGKGRIKYRVLADIQSDRTYVAGPTSMVHGRTYELITDMPIQQITIKRLNELFGYWLRAEDARRVVRDPYVPTDEQKEKEHYGCWDIMRLSKSEFVQTYQNKDFVWCVCPVCGASQGNSKNFCISKRGYYWRCEHSSESGGPVQLLAHLENINTEDALSIIKEWRVNEV